MRCLFYLFTDIPTHNISHRQDSSHVITERYLGSSRRGRWRLLANQSIFDVSIKLVKFANMSF